MNGTQTSAVSSSASPPALPPFAPEVEVRLAVVMYGGVSLAIYINGVAQELLRMVRATAPSKPSHEAPGEPLLKPEELRRGSERVYRKLGQMLADQPRPFAEIKDDDPIRRRFMVDILSGTSAGGINAVFLAKALANQQSLEYVKQLWVEEGGIEKLINDKKSSKDAGLPLQKPPQSLLNSRRMFRKLLDAFQGMETPESQAHQDDVTASPFVDELDLFVTTTDITGLKLPLKLSDKIIWERRYRNVFHFLYASKFASGDPRNDFEPWNNPMLAYASRCTSSFPFAFEPMTLADVTEAPQYQNNSALFDEDKKEWLPFFKDYLRLGGPPAQAGQDAFVTRAFGDGGYLDNKPFSYATDSLLRRRSNVLVDRKLLYIEPSPDHPENETDSVEKPDALQNVTAASMSLPHQETIREDLERLLQRNRLLNRVERILTNTELDVGVYFENQTRPKVDPGIDWAKRGLKEMIQQRGPGYGGYHRLKVSILTDELAALLARVAGFDEDSDEFEAIRYLVREWRDLHYEADKGSSTNLKKTENQFLLEFDLSYRLRRLNFVLSEIDEIYPFNDHALEVIRATGVKYSAFDPDKDQQRLRTARAELLGLKKQLSQSVIDLRRAGRHFRSRNADNPLRPLVMGLKLTKEMFQKLWSQSNERNRKNYAKDLILDPERAAALEKLAQELAAQSKTVFEKASKDCAEVLNPPNASLIHRCLWHYYCHYEDYDFIRFPIIAGTEAAECDEVEIFRVSPEDATALINEKASGCGKLAGVSYGHFGAFMDKLWRQSDMLWGRLDGAERIITALLPGSDECARCIRERMILEASAEILAEEVRELGLKEARQLIVEAFMRTASDKPNSKALADFVRKVHPITTDAHLQAVLELDALLNFYDHAFAQKAHPDREDMLRSLARSTQVVGKMLDGLGERYACNSKQIPATLVLVGRVLWGLVEVSVPRRMLQLLFRYWIRLLYLFETLLIIGGVALGFPTAYNLGLTCLGVTAVLDLAPRLLSVWMTGQKLTRLLKALGVLVLLALLFLGAWKVFSLVAEFSDWVVKLYK